MYEKDQPHILSLSSCLTALVCGMIVFIALFAFFSVSGLNEQKMQPDTGTQLTVIPAPTITITPVVTKEPQTLDVRYVSPEGLSLGSYVVIAGTGNTGLSVRPTPGTGGTLNFVARDGERYQITDGPESKNDYVWWKLQSTEDQNKIGWAAANYLKLAEQTANGE